MEQNYTVTNAELNETEQSQEKQRTKRQNRSLHKGYALIAQALNDSGQDMKTFLKPSVQIPWTMESVKTHIWKPLQEAMLEKESTTELNTKQIDEIWEVMSEILGKRGIYVKFPTSEPPIYNPEEYGY